jgi:hypothetical protein
MYRHAYSRRIRLDHHAAEQPYDRLVCAVCGFPGVPTDQAPAERLGSKPVIVTGTTYIGVAADAAVSTFDKHVDVVRQPGECPCCGAELFLDGARGSGLRRH